MQIMLIWRSITRRLFRSILMRTYQQIELMLIFRVQGFFGTKLFPQDRLRSVNYPFVPPTDFNTIIHLIFAVCDRGMNYTLNRNMIQVEES